MIKWKKLITLIFIPLFVGFIGTLLGNSKQFVDVVQPSFTPPKIVFPIAWSILYILMGISSYLVLESNSDYKRKGITMYIIQLSINCIWNLFFFRLKMFMFAFWLVLILIAINIIMILYYLKCNKLAGYLQIPYILWLTFAAILTYNIHLLN